MVQWEYKITGPQTDFAQTGLEGWELTAIEGASIYWKRPVATEAPKPAVVVAPPSPSTSSTPPSPSKGS